ncbi:hypothetical protein F8M41_013996 [Gigaspora margarita]|uniref:Uncharacterized protein n=1 Tax=Gigaspora margarita TaxID=4874 RepID=A0A8H3WX18_GIGMA|nr:hypothetical protein F8M41_013996 [Gigaspora margarita]
MKYSLSWVKMLKKVVNNLPPKFLRLKLLDFLTRVETKKKKRNKATTYFVLFRKFEVCVFIIQRKKIH